MGGTSLALELRESSKDEEGKNPRWGKESRLQILPQFFFFFFLIKISKVSQAHRARQHSFNS